MLEMRKLFLLSVTCALALVATATCHGASLVTNGDFATDLTGWAMRHVTSGDEHVTAEHISAGYPGGAVKLDRPGDYVTGNHRFYQFISIAPSTKYYVRAQWKGDLSGGSTGSGTVEWYAGFTTQSEPNIADPLVNGTSLRRVSKVWNTTTGTYTNIAATGQWDLQKLAWNGTSNATTNKYLFIAFNLSGISMNPTSARPYVIVDNVSVCASATDYFNADTNYDCVVNFVDIGILASQWLTCQLDPQTSCW